METFKITHLVVADAEYVVLLPALAAVVLAPREGKPASEAEPLQEECPRVAEPQGEELRCCRRVH